LADVNSSWLKSQAQESVLLDYAARYWTKHYRLVQDSADKSLTSIAKVLLSAVKKRHGFLISLVLVAAPQTVPKMQILSHWHATLDSTTSSMEPRAKT
jgi:hypothetical protein